MAKRTSDPRQLDLDDYYVVPTAPEPAPGSLSYAAEVCAALARALKDTPLSRAEVAARMSDLTGEVITEPMLNAWTAKSHERHRFPIEFAAAFEVATDSTVLQHLLASKRGSLVLVGKQARDARLGLLRRKMAEMRAEERALMRELDE